MKATSPSAGGPTLLGVSVSLYEQQTKSLQKTLETQRSKQADQEHKAAKADSDAFRYETEAGRTSSDNTRKMKLRQAGDKRKEGTEARKKAAVASEAVAKATKELGKAQAKLGEARAKEQKKEDDKRRREQERADQKRQGEDRQREREVRDLRTQTGQLETRLQNLAVAKAPETITVLFIAASPEDQTPLRLDKEVREIQQRVRASEHRESVQFEMRLATQLPDIVQALNETRPHIVHFSGHGNQDSLVFEDDDGRTKPLTNELLDLLLHASSDRIRLMVLNSCRSSAQAALALGHIDAAIGMELPVADEAAKIFAGQFYNSLGFGHSLQQAFDQACFQVKATSGELSGAPALHVAEGLDAKDLVLVAP